MAAANEEPVKIEHKLCITGGGCRAPWMVSNTITVDGMLFITLKRTDVGFIRFLCGSARGVHNWQKYRELMLLRTEASFRSVMKEQSSLFEEEQRISKRQKVKARDMADEVPALVEIEVPSCSYKDTQMPSLKIKVLSSLHRDSPLSVHGEAAVLTHIRVFIMSGNDADAQRPAKDCLSETVSSHVVRWHSTRNGWIAYKGGSSKSFRPQNLDDPESVEEAKQNALSWARQ